MSECRPRASAEEVERMRRWHDEHYAYRQGVGPQGQVFEHLMDSNGFTRAVAARRGLVKDGVDVEYRTYRLTPG